MLLVLLALARLLLQREPDVLVIRELEASGVCVSAVLYLRRVASRFDTCCFNFLTSLCSASLMSMLSEKNG